MKNDSDIRAAVLCGVITACTAALVRAIKSQDTPSEINDSLSEKVRGLINQLKDQRHEKKNLYYQDPVSKAWFSEEYLKWCAEEEEKLLKEWKMKGE